MIDKSKQYRTRDGREVRIYAVDGSGSMPVHGAIKNNYGWEPYQWIADGMAYLNDRPEDLIEVKPRIKRKGWVNVYRHDNGDEFAEVSLTEALPRQRIGCACIACVEIDIDVEEGHGL